MTVSPAHPGFSHEELDELRHAISVAVVRTRTAQEIRGKILANLDRWERQGTWARAYDEWRKIAQSGDDGLLLAVMLGRDEEAVRLRQSMPYVGLLSEAELRELHENAGGWSDAPEQN